MVPFCSTLLSPIVPAFGQSWSWCLAHLCAILIVFFCYVFLYPLCLCVALSLFVCVCDCLCACVVVVCFRCLFFCAGVRATEHFEQAAGGERKRSIEEMRGQEEMDEVCNNV